MKGIKDLVNSKTGKYNISNQWNKKKNEFERVKYLKHTYNILQEKAYLKPQKKS